MSFYMSDLKNKVVALLPMKANSERVRGKNFRNFNGKPLFQWVLDTLLSVEEIDLIVINTDAQSILAKHGLFTTDRILIRDRKPEICGDFVSMNLVLADDIANIKSETYLMTHVTNPLLTSKTVKRALELYREGYWDNSADSVFTVNKFQTRFYRSDGTAINHDPNKLVRTQDLEPWFEENSNLYVFSEAGFLETNARIGKRPLMLEINKNESVDIDDEQGWELAEAIAMYKERYKND